VVWFVVHGLSRSEKLLVKNDSGIDKILKLHGFVRTTESISVGSYFAYVGRNALFLYRLHSIVKDILIAENGARINMSNIIPIVRDTT
jgi:hypothetical protein